MIVLSRRTTNAVQALRARSLASTASVRVRGGVDPTPPRLSSPPPAPAPLARRRGAPDMAPTPRVLTPSAPTLAQEAGGCTPTDPRRHARPARELRRNGRKGVEFSRSRTRAIAETRVRLSGSSPNEAKGARELPTDAARPWRPRGGRPSRSGDTDVVMPIPTPGGCRANRQRLGKGKPFQSRSASP